MQKEIKRVILVWFGYLSLQGMEDKVFDKMRHTYDCIQKKSLFFLPASETTGSSCHIDLQMRFIEIASNSFKGLTRNKLGLFHYSGKLC